MLNGFLKKLTLITILGVGGLMLGSCSSSPAEQVLDKTPITINIPSKISNEILSITLPRCAFELNEKELSNNSLTSDEAILTYNFLSYSGNLKNNFECTLDKTSSLYGRNHLRPIYPLADGQAIDSGYDYLTKILNALGNTVIEESPFVQIRFVDAYQEMLLIKGMPNQSTPFTLRYFKYDGSVNSAPSYHYSVETIIQDKFYFQYKIFILVPENRHGHNLPDYNTDFAEKFRDVIQANGNVLDQHDLVQGFVDNNERVVKYINENSFIANN